MIIKKTAELYLKNNDIYILESHNNTIIVNNNDQGLLILNDSLRIQKLLTVPQEAPIYSLYKKYDNSALILYLPDAHKIILINIETDEHYVITLSEAFYKEVLSPNYYWNNDTLILTTTNNDFYQLDFASKTLHQISYDTAQEICPFFYNFWNICKKYNVLTYYPDKKSFIFQKNDSSVGFLNYEQNKEYVMREIRPDWHDIEYKNGFFCLIHENEIEMWHDKDKNILTPHANFIFLKAKFLDNNHFVVLSSNPSNYQESLLKIYKIN